MDFEEGAAGHTGVDYNRNLLADIPVVHTDDLAHNWSVADLVAVDADDHQPDFREEACCHNPVVNKERTGSAGELDNQQVGGNGHNRVVHSVVGKAIGQREVLARPAVFEVLSLSAVE